MKVEKIVQSKGINYKVVIHYFDSNSSSIDKAYLYDQHGDLVHMASSFHALGTRWQHLFSHPISLAKELVETHEQNMQKKHQESEQIKSFHQWDGQL